MYKKLINLEDVALGDECTIITCDFSPLIDVKILSNGHDPLQEVEIVNNNGFEDYIVGEKFSFGKKQKVSRKVA